AARRGGRRGRGKEVADLRGGGGGGGAADPPPPLRRRVEPGDRSQHRRLAAAGAADDDEDFTRRDDERNAVERAHPVGIGLADPVENEHPASLHLRPKRSSQTRNGDDTSTTSQSLALPRMPNAT